MATDLFLDRSISTILGVSGLFILALAWRLDSKNLERIAPLGWVLTGFYFFNETPLYYSHEDMVMTIMSAACLPGAIGIAMWEAKAVIPKETKALRWFRGAVAFAGLPYLLIAHVPWFNVMAIWFVAWQSGLLLSWSGAGQIKLGDTWVNPANGPSVRWEEWDGNRWFLSEEMAEYSFHTELLLPDGTPLYINFVLACTAIQSMIIFVGAISVLQIDWRKRVRALFIALSLIHILNIFRNAGLIWLQSGYSDWRWMGLTIFEFGHAYAARVVSLGAMFLLALVLFEMMPLMHRHVLVLLKPLGLSPGKKKEITKGES